MERHYTMLQIDWIRDEVNHQIDLETRAWSTVAASTNRFHVSSAQVRLVLEAIREFDKYKLTSEEEEL